MYNADFIALKNRVVALEETVEKLEETIEILSALVMSS